MLETAKRELEALQKIPATAGLAVTVAPELYDAYLEARRAHETAGAALAHAELELKRAIGSGETVKVRGRIVATWAMHHRTFFDSASFRSKHPAMWERFQRSGAVRQFRVLAFAATPPARTAKAQAKGKRR